MWSLSPITLTLLGTASLWLLVRLWSAYKRMLKVSRNIEQIPGPPVTNFFLGHLGLLWQSSGNDWFQRKYILF